MPAVTRWYHFEASHFLPYVHEGHKCKRMHGHNYEFEVSIWAPHLNHGFVIDFWDIDEIIAPILDEVDHRTLNDVPGLENPTAEIIAQWIYRRLNVSFQGSVAHCRVTAVRVWETSMCSAIYCRLDEEEKPYMPGI